MRLLPTSCTLRARVSCIMELCHGMNFASLGIKGVQDEVHTTERCSMMMHAMFYVVLYAVMMQSTFHAIVLQSRMFYDFLCRPMLCSVVCSLL